jgi:hypothetical protein
MVKPSKFGFDLLGDSNYATWRVQMKGLLATKDCLRAITEANDPNSSKAMGLLIMCVEEQHLQTIERANSAMEAWNALAALYRQTSTANLLQLRKELTTLEKKADESIPQYMARARCIADQIRSATGNEVVAADLVLAVLAGLPSEYSMVRTVIENMAALPSLGEIQAKLLMVEKQYAHLETTGDTALYTKVDAARKPGKFRKVDKFANQVNTQEDMECWFCKEFGHMKRDCPKRKQYKEGACGLFAYDVVGL